jgi:hypothetical protein
MPLPSVTRTARGPPTIRTSGPPVSAIASILGLDPTNDLARYCVQQTVDAPVGVAMPVGLTVPAVHGPDEGVTTTFASETSPDGSHVTGGSNSSGGFEEHVPFVVV